MMNKNNKKQMWKTTSAFMKIIINRLSMLYNS